MEWRQTARCASKLTFSSLLSQLLHSCPLLSMNSRQYQYDMRSDQMEYSTISVAIRLFHLPDYHTASSLL